MGRFVYEGTQKMDLEDRALTHLQLVVTAKLRRAEPFAFSWRDDPSIGGGKTTVWVHPQANIVFQFFGSRRPAVNRAWVDALAFTALGPNGLHMVPEPAGSPTTGSIAVRDGGETWTDEATAASLVP